MAAGGGEVEAEEDPPQPAISAKETRSAAWTKIGRFIAASSGSHGLSI